MNSPRFIQICSAHYGVNSYAPASQSALPSGGEFPSTGRLLSRWSCETPHWPCGTRSMAELPNESALVNVRKPSASGLSLGSAVVLVPVGHPCEHDPSSMTLYPPSISTMGVGTPGETPTPLPHCGAFPLPFP